MLSLRRVSDSEISTLRARRAQRASLSPLAAALWDDIRAAITIPASKLDYSQATAMRLALRDLTQAQVQATMGGQGTIVRDLAAYDVSGAVNGGARYGRLSNVNTLVARTWFVNDLGFLKIPQYQAIGIYGYQALAANPLIDAIAFSLGGGAVLGQFWLAPIYADSVSTIGYFDPPIVYRPGQQFGVNLLSEAGVAAGAESYQLLGYVAEPGGATVAPDQSNLV